MNKAQVITHLEASLESNLQALGVETVGMFPWVSNLSNSDKKVIPLMHN